jgi:hypothetical protein
MASTLDTVFNIITTIWDVFKWTWWLFIVGWLVALKVKWKSWPLEAIIIEKRGNNLVKTNDRAGKYSDKFTNITGYRLLKAKETIPVINFEWILHNNYKATSLLEKFVHMLRGDAGTIFFFKYGTKQYKPVYIKNNQKSKRLLNELKDKDGNSVIIKVYEQFDPRRHLGALDFEVVDWDNMNFMVQEQRASIIRRQKQGEWVKQYLIPILIIGATIIFCIIMIKYGYDFAMDLKTSSTSNNNPPAEQPATVPKIPIIGDLIPGK